MKKLLFLSILLIILTACANQRTNTDMPKKIRQPAVAGQFYPNQSAVLREKIQGFLDQVVLADSYPVKAIIAPHAGYDYSGAVAAYGFKRLEKRKINTVVLISNSHQAYFKGAAVDDHDVWRTPLGEVAVDKELAEKLVKADPAVKFDGSPHQGDHNLETQLPFLQTVLQSGFKIVAIEFGNQGGEVYKKLARALADNLGEDDLVVASTDMSHYPKYADANKIDTGTLEKIRAGEVGELEKYLAAAESASYANEQTALCGADAVKTVMELAKLAGPPAGEAGEASWQAEVLKYANSGDTAIGDKDQVVGYGAVAYAQVKNVNLKMQNAKATSTEAAATGELNNEQQKTLLEIAKKTVESFVKSGKIPKFNVADERLNQKQGAFVTLNKNGQLRGCIGQIVPTDEPLWQVVRDMAVAAASEDGRFEPVSAGELEELEYEVSVLSVPARIDDWKKIKLGKQGVILGRGRNRGVFLPQVATETGWGLEEFLSQLCFQKAGLEPSCYKDKDTEIQVFTAQVIN